MASFYDILEKYRRKAFSERDKGTRFELLMQRFMQSYPLYQGMFVQVWMWNEFPFKNDFGGKDIGIDLVALTVDGEYWAVQYSIGRSRSGSSSCSSLIAFNAT
ncbi:MAG: hypothetical protein MSS66_04400 [Selenomonadaceae bacterium]|nr:hypothetical protein [Selenomonadaceae bacterium]